MKPNVKKYLNVFQYLQDVYSVRKEQEPGFSYDQWAQELSASDKSYVRFMVLGKRPINSRMAQLFAENLQLDADHAEYFKNLVAYSQSKTYEEKAALGKKVISLLKNEINQQEIAAHFEFLSNKFLPRLQVLLSFSDVQQDAKALAWILDVDEEQVAQGLATLQDLGLIERNEERFASKSRSFKVGDHFGNLGLEAFYISNLEEAQKAIQLPKESRRYKSLFLPLNSSEFAEFVESVNAFSKEQLAKFNPDQYADRRLYQVHLNIIPVTQAVAEV